jgi:hypothetical protein
MQLIQSSDMALARSPMSKFLGVLPLLSPPLDVPAFVARCLHVRKEARDPSSERWSCGRERCLGILAKNDFRVNWVSFTSRKYTTWDRRWHYFILQICDRNKLLPIHENRVLLHDVHIIRAAFSFEIWLRQLKKFVNWSANFSIFGLKWTRSMTCANWMKSCFDVQH